MKLLKALSKAFAFVIVGAALLVAFINFGKYIFFAEFYSTAESAAEIPGLDDGFVMQGLDSYNGGFLVSGYMADKSASRIYYVNRVVSKYTALRKVDGSDFKGHSGGIAHNGDYLYVGGSGGVYVFSVSDVLDGDGEATQLGFFDTLLNAAWCEVADGYLIAGSFWYEPDYKTAEWQHVTTPAGDKNHSMMTVFKLDDTAEFGINPTPVCAISTNMKVQGAAFTEDGIILSTSLGFSPSTLEFHTLNTEVWEERFVPSESGEHLVKTYYLDSSTKAHVISAPPMAEEIAVEDGRIYVMNESASSKYIFGRLLGMECFYSIEYSKEYFKK